MTDIRVMGSIAFDREFSNNTLMGKLNLVSNQIEIILSHEIFRSFSFKRFRCLVEELGAELLSYIARRVRGRQSSAYGNFVVNENYDNTMGLAQSLSCPWEGQ